MVGESKIISRFVQSSSQDCTVYSDKNSLTSRLYTGEPLFATLKLTFSPADNFQVRFT